MFISKATTTFFRKCLLEEISFFAVFVLFFLVQRLNVIKYFGTRFLGGTSHDAGLYVWLTKEARNSFFNGNFETSSFYPFGKSLAWSDNYILPSLLDSIAGVLGDPLSYNLIFSLTCSLNGYCVFRLTRYITKNYKAALVSGVAFQSFGFLQQHYGHPQLQWVFWIPLGIESFLRFKDVSNVFDFKSLRDKNTAGLLIASCALLGAFLTSVYYSIFLVAAFILLLFAYPVKTASSVYYTLIHSRLVVGLSFVAICGLFYCILPYLSIKHSFGSRNLWEPFYFSASGISYFSASSLSFFYSKTSSFSHAEARLFPGVTVWVLGLLGFCSSVEFLAPFVNFKTFSIRYWHLLLVQMMLFFLILIFSTYEYRLLAVICSWLEVLIFVVELFLVKNNNQIVKQGRALFFIGFIFFCISLGPLGFDAFDENAMGIGRFAFDLLPGFEAIRAVGRAGIVAVLVACIGISFFLARYANRSVFYLAIGALIFIENWHPIVPIEGKSLAPEVLAEKHTATDVLLTLPLVTTLTADKGVGSWSDFSRLNVEAMLWSQDYNWQTMNGYSGQRTYVMERLPYLLRNFPDQESLSYLRRFPNLNFVLYRSSQIKDFDKAVFESAIKSAASSLTLVSHDESGNYFFRLSRQYYMSLHHVLRVPSYCRGLLQFEVSSNQNTSFSVKSSAEELLFKIGIKSERINVNFTKNPLGVMPYEVNLASEGGFFIKNVFFGCL
jgi:hypothetical protein